MSDNWRSGGINRTKALGSWNIGNHGSSFNSMMYHYNSHVVNEGLNAGRLSQGLFGGGMLTTLKTEINHWRGTLLCAMGLMRGLSLRSPPYRFINIRINIKF